MRLVLNMVMKKRIQRYGCDARSGWPYSDGFADVYVV